MGMKDDLQKHIAKLAFNVICGKGAFVVITDSFNEFKNFFYGVFL